MVLYLVPYMWSLKTCSSEQNPLPVHGGTQTFPLCMCRYHWTALTSKGNSSTGSFYKECESIYNVWSKDINYCRDTMWAFHSWVPEDRHVYKSFKSLEKALNLKLRIQKVFNLTKYSKLALSISVIHPPIHYPTQGHQQPWRPHRGSQHFG